MFGEVIAAHESALAHGTHKLFLPGVRPPVPGELVGAGEPLIAAVPAAAERLLTYGGRERKRRESEESANESRCSHKGGTPQPAESDLEQ